MGLELTILFPCLNEAETIGTCIRRVQDVLEVSKVNAEILVADNGSDDGSQRIAVQSGARVSQVSKLGYGRALRHGIQNSKGRFVVFADADDSYMIEDFPVFLEELRNGTHFVIGNRFAGGIQSGAMPWANRYIGNPLLSGIGRMLFGCAPRDLHCGMRGVNKEEILKVNLECDGMEFASEMVIKAHLAGIKIKEVPTGLRVDGRSRPPHLRPLRDGRRHLTLMVGLKAQQIAGNLKVLKMVGDNAETTGATRPNFPEIR